MTTNLFGHPAFTPSRLDSLFADFINLRDANPDGYAANTAAWSSLLTTRLASRDLPLHHHDHRTVIRFGPALTHALAVAAARPDPAGLYIVRHELLASGQAVTLAEFENHVGSIKKGKLANLHSSYSSSSSSFYSTAKSSALSFIYGAPASLASWVFRDTFITHTVNRFILATTSNHHGYDRGKDTEQDLVILANLDTLAASLLVAVRESDHAVFTFDALHGLVPDVTALDLRLLITYVSRDLAVAIVDHAEQVIKFLTVHQTSKPENLAITQDEIAAAKIRQAIIKLSTNIANQSAAAVTARDTARLHVVALADRTLAKADLATARQLESHVAIMLRSRLQLETLAASIEAARTNVHVVELLHDAVPALQGLNKQAAKIAADGDENAGVDSVHELLDRVNEAVADTDQVSHALAEPVSSTTESELDLAVEQEFEELLLLQQQQQQKSATDESADVDKVARLLSQASLNPPLQSPKHDADSTPAQNNPLPAS
ncbi:hypothetical protein V1514DRAFT_305134 [Lipomyces japonicus]|uniref:uncharacterized protein n=1 Tax=Lipomyces japonicus TaxID=56871 RepID=UPI0034CF7770